MGRRRNQSPKPKKVNYELIPREPGGLFASPMYALLDELVDKVHDHLRAARFAFAWCTAWKPDVDGICKSAMIRRTSDLDREFAPYDFVILVNRPRWTLLDATARRALIDHELCHARQKIGPDGEQAEDERGNPQWRLAKHEIEGFIGEYERNGAWTNTLERALSALVRQPLPVYEPCATCSEGDAGASWIRFIDARGTSRVKHCECWFAWKDRCDALMAAKATSAEHASAEQDNEPEADEVRGQDDFQGVLPDPAAVN